MNGFRTLVPIKEYSVGEAADNALAYFCRRNDLSVRPRHDKVRHRVLRCPTCGKGPLRFLEDPTDVWYLAEFDEDNKLTRHVCKLRW